MRFSGEVISQIRPERKVEKILFRNSPFAIFNIRLSVPPVLSYWRQRTSGRMDLASCRVIVSPIDVCVGGLPRGKAAGRSRETDSHRAMSQGKESF